MLVGRPARPLELVRRHRHARGLLAYARDVAALDVVALTDHDHWGSLFLDEHPELWERIQRAHGATSTSPGRFVTVLGYEWTNWIYGHRHVLYFGDDAAEV